VRKKQDVLVQMNVLVPERLRGLLVAKARKNKLSLNKEVQARLEASFRPNAEIRETLNVLSRAVDLIKEEFKSIKEQDTADDDKPET
jgi:hypothetical protein